MIFPERRLADLAIALPSPPVPVAAYVTHRRVGSLLFLSGQGPTGADGKPCVGKVGGSIGIDDAYRHARWAGLTLLAVMRSVAGRLDHIERIVALRGMVNASPDFTAHSRVIDGCSDLFVEVFGRTRGLAARSAFGCSSLPNMQTVEIEAIVKIKKIKNQDVRKRKDET